MKATCQLPQQQTLTVSATVTLQANSTPIAEAGPDRSVTESGQVRLDGTQSYDPDGDPITYQWFLLEVPGDSTAVLTADNTSTPAFVVDMYGMYVARLTVTDSHGASAQDIVTISFENAKPVAVAGPDQSVTVGDMVTLNGSGSYDPNGDSLYYRWTFVSVPAGSASQIAYAASATFVPDRAGTYSIQLVVNDLWSWSNPSTIQIVAVPSQRAAVQAAEHAHDVVSSFYPFAFKNRNMKNALLNKLEAVIHDIEAGNYAIALDQLQNDILIKTDGCARIGVPDANDWIRIPADQAMLYPLVVELIATVRAMG